MSKAKRAYYDEFYANKDVRKSSLPKLTALSHQLQRFALPANQLIFELLSPGDRLLDLGCGDGDFALLAKILRKGRELVILVPNDAWLVYRLQSLVGKIPQSGGVDKIGVDWGHLHKFNGEIARNLLLSNGFKVTNVCCSGVFAKLRSLWLSLLASDIIIKAIVTK
jgi:hypothetical protein